MSMSLLIQNLCSGYNEKMILQDISLSVENAEILAIIGQNGCGKSTLLKTIARIIEDNSGNIIFDNMALNNRKTWDLKELGISLFVQGGMVFPTLKVSEHFQLALKDKTKVEAADIQEECFAYFPTLANYMDRRGGNLSGGQRQMLSFAMLLSQQTRCWLLDEPTAGLSPSMVNEAIEFLATMKRRADKTMILVEHNYSVVFELADQIAIIKEGRVYDNFRKVEFLKDDFIETHLYN